MFKECTRILATLGIAAMLVSPANAQVVLRGSGAFTEGHTASKAMDAFKKKVEERSKGEIRVDLFHNNKLG
ncbi:MAG: hypothetical protein AB7O70_08900, partial [Hyphomicrobiales bacterium]